MKNIIGVSAKQGGGKTTVCNILSVKLKEHFENVVIHRIRFAHYIYLMHDSIRNILKRHDEGLKKMGIHYDFEKKDGHLLQQLGTNWARNTINQNIWATLTRLEIDRVLGETVVGTLPFILIEDLRFENEFNILPEGSLRVRLEASEEVRKTRAEMWRENTTHPSEVDLDQYSEDGKFDMYFMADILTAHEIVEGVITKLKEGT